MTRGHTFFLFILITLFSSCATRERCARFFPQSQETSTHSETVIREIVRDSLIPIPPDSSWLKALLECDSAGNVLLRQITELQAGQRVKPSITLTGNILKVDCKVDSAAVYFSWKERHITKATDSLVFKTTTVPVNFVTDWQSFQIYLGRIFMAVMAGAALFLIFKYKSRLF